MEVAYVDGIDSQSTAGCVARPRPERSGDEHEKHPNAASTKEKHAQGGVKTAYKESKDWGGADIHQASIRTL